MPDLLDRLAWDADDLPRQLSAASGWRIDDAESLIRLHERLLFLRAYPRNAEVLRLADSLLFSFARRTAECPDLEPFEDPTVSGIAGTSLSAVFSFEVARRLHARYPRQIQIDWENYDRTDKFGPVLRRLLPLVEEDWPVEAHVAFRAWMDAAKPRGASELGWLLDRIERLPLSARDRADLYESLELLLVWQIRDVRTSRSRLRLPVRKPFYHDGPLLRRADVSLARELEAPPMAITRLSRAQARKILDVILDTSAMRYRELYGFTHPDIGHVYRADAGRGVEVYFFGVPPEWRLPLRAYHCGMYFKNGVPIGYVEVLSLFERAEIGFNLYYTFRDGESAWLYARLLRLFRQMLGVTCFSVDPYQLGWQNEEALESGAFWFYRKLGFRPLDADVARLVEREERKMRQTPGYRSSPRTLDKLARSYVLFEGPGSHPGDWDKFRARKLAMALDPAHLFDIVPGNEAIMRAKHGPEESRYLRLMQRHLPLRAAMIKLGS